MAPRGSASLVRDVAERHHQLPASPIGEHLRRTHAVFLHPRNEAHGLSDLFMVRFDTSGLG